ncbi:MAG: hypothetical protein ACO20H_06865 [Bacteriovoracaceae bacterium]
MIKILLLAILFYSCENKEEVLNKGKSVYLPPSFFEDKVDPCSSKDFNILIKNRCELHKIKSSYLKNKKEFFETPFSKELHISLAKHYPIDLFYFLDQKGFLDRLDHEHLFSEGIKGQNSELIHFLMEKKESLYVLLFNDLNYSKMKFIDEFIKRGTLSASKMVQTENGVEFPLLWLAKTSYKNFNYSDQELFKELVRLIMSKVTNNLQWEFEDKKSNNLLHLCAKSDNDYLAAEVIEKFPYLLRQLNSKGRTPIHISLYNNAEFFYETVKDRFQAQDLLIEDYFQESPLELMVKFSRLKFLKLAFDNEQQELLRTHRDSRGRNLLHLATIYGKVRMAFELARIGVNPKEKDLLGRDAEYFATEGAKRYPFMGKNFEKLLRLFKIVKEHGHDTLSDDDADALLKG